MFTVQHAGSGVITSRANVAIPPSMSTKPRATQHRARDGQCDAASRESPPRYGSLPAVWMLAVDRHAERTLQLLLIEEVGRFRELQDATDRRGRRAVQMRDGQELGPRCRIVQAAKCLF